MATDEPYCGACGYTLTGLTDSSRCPECGRPLVDVLRRSSMQRARGRRYTSPVRLFGLPLVQMATGPGADGPRGRARAIIAVGDQACGLLACGGLAVGLVAFGGLAVGVFAVGGMAVGLLAWGGWAMGGVVLGGGALGLVAVAGGAIGLVAVGGGAIGLFYATGGGAWARSVTTAYRRDQAAVDFFGDHGWFFGDGSSPGMFFHPLLWTGVVLLALLVFVGALASFAYVSHRESEG